MHVRIYLAVKCGKESSYVFMNMDLGAVSP